MPKPPRSLSDLQIRNMKAPSKRREIPLGDGLYLVHAPTGAKSWAYRYRHFDKPNKVTLGRFMSPTDMLPETLAAPPRIGQPLSIAGARLLVQQGRLALAQGADPKRILAGEGPKAKPKEIGAAFEAFFKDHVEVRNRPSTARESRRLFETKVRPSWMGRSVENIRRTDVVDLLQSVRDGGAPISANRTLALVRKFFNWCVEQDLIETSPCGRVRPPAVEKSRDRYLSEHEIGLVWRASAKLPEPYRQWVRMLLLTGQRRGEISRLRWSQLALQDRQILFPRGDTKNNKPHVAHLNAPALAELASLKRIKGSPDFVFTSGRTRQDGALTPFSGYSKLKARLDALIRDIIKEDAVRLGMIDTPSMPAWCWHDLRRTVATGMQRMGVEQRVVEKALNHISGSTSGIVSVYQVHEFMNERQAAFEAWGEQLLALGEAQQ
ncbi:MULTISPECIES: tyrosine-type recombinase/integrase [Brevundimonas]|uniref:tyrosine-type recombinase/integrase n=1 Tax=Brevundimonas TaxID=41275 RepID=UPI0025BA75A7|nr:MULTISPECIES: site-specific integrase [Brevundimonas]